MLSFDRWRTGERSIQKFYGSYREGSRTWYAVIIGTDGCRQKQMFVTVFSSPCSITTCLCCIRREADDATTNYDVRRKAEIRLPYVGMSNRMPDFAVFSVDWIVTTSDWRILRHQLKPMQHISNQIWQIRNTARFVAMVTHCTIAMQLHGHLGYNQEIQKLQSRFTFIARKIIWNWAEK